MPKYSLTQQNQVIFTTTTTTIAQFLQCKKSIQQNQGLVTTTSPLPLFDTTNSSYCDQSCRHHQILINTILFFNTIESSSLDHHHHHFLTQCNKVLSQQGKEKRKQRKPQMAIRFFLGGIFTFFQPAKYDFDTYSPDCTYFPRL
jgi:hypothetical protein